MKPDIHHLMIYLLAGAALLALAFIILVGYLASQLPYDGFSWSNRRGTVITVAKGGPAFGLVEPGDRILAVDGATLPLNNSIYLGKQIGDTVVFTVERQEQIISIPIRLMSAPWNIQFTLILPSLIALTFWGAGVFVLTFQGNAIQNALFLLVCLIASIALAAGSVSASGPPLVNRLFSLSLCWLVPLVFSLHLEFPRNSASQHLRLVEWLLFTVAALASFVTGIWLPFHPGSSVISSALPIFHRIWLTLGLMAVVYLLIRSYKNETSGQSRRQVGVVALGGTAAILIFTGLSLFPDLLLHWQILPYNLSLVFLILIPSSYGYAIARFHFMPLSSHVNRNIASAFSLILFLGLLLILSVVLAHLAPPELWQRPLGILFFTILIAGIVTPLKSGVQRLVYRLFYGESFNYPAAISKVSAALREAGSNPETGLALVHELRQAMQLEYAAIFFSGAGNSSFIGGEARANDLAKPAGGRLLAGDSLLVRHFRSHPAPQPAHLLRLDLNGQVRSQTEANLLVDEQIRYWIPIYGSRELFGILAVGAKLGSGELSQEDLEILQMIARQAGSTLENAHLANELQQRKREYDRLHQQALLAREEERKRLAWELHDRSIQALSGVGYHLAGLQHHVMADGQGPLKEILENVQQIIDDLRGLCADLRPPTLDTLGLAAAIRYQVRTFGKKLPFRIMLSVAGDEERDYPEELALCLYRSLQEALLNAQKHAHARRVKVRLRLEPQQVGLEVEDDGNGFTPPASFGRLSADGHFGLMGMHERSQCWGEP